jgi:hypothetical protein
VHSLAAGGSDEQLSARLDHPPNFADSTLAGTNVVENHRDEDNIKGPVRKRLIRGSYWLQTRSMGFRHRKILD